MHMNPKRLLTYLKDHLAGATGSPEVVDHFIYTHVGKPLEPSLRVFREEIVQDRQALQDIIRRMGSAESPFRNTGTRLSERLARIKLLLEGAGSRPLA
jgi:hypothetical protein